MSHTIKSTAEGEENALGDDVHVAALPSEVPCRSDKRKSRRDHGDEKEHIGTRRKEQSAALIAR